MLGIRLQESENVREWWGGSAIGAHKSVVFSAMVDENLATTPTADSASTTVPPPLHCGPQNTGIEVGRRQLDRDQHETTSSKQNEYKI